MKPLIVENKVLTASRLETILGPMQIIADESKLYLLEFHDQKKLTLRNKKLNTQLNATIIPGETRITKQIKKELENYFNGKSSEFKTPLQMLGTPFQQTVWKALLKIPVGKTQSYLELAGQIKHPKSYRAVANANGANQLAVIIPCHRVINHNGNLGGYGGGITRKQWLIEHELRNFK